MCKSFRLFGCHIEISCEHDIRKMALLYNYLKFGMWITHILTHKKIDVYRFVRSRTRSIQNKTKIRLILVYALSISF